MRLNESELYKELGVLTKDKSRWEENVVDERMPCATAVITKK